MMMVDGHEPMLGSDQPKALPAIERALSEPPGVRLKLAVDGADRSRKLSVRVTANSKAVVGRDLLVGVAVVEDPVTTKVPSGENAGKTLVEHHAVRAFSYQTARLDRARSKNLAFPLKSGTDWVAGHCRVAVFVQDQDNGKVYQADSLPWTTEERRRQSRLSGAKAGEEQRAFRPHARCLVTDFPGLSLRACAHLDHRPGRLYGAPAPTVFLDPFPSTASQPR